MNILEAQDLRKYYATQKAVDDISFTVGRGSIFGLLGPNGAGKTTLIRMITGIFYPDQGSILLKGEPFRPDRDLSRIGYMPEERGLYKKMKIGEQAIYLARLKGLSRHEATTRAKAWFVKLQMESWWNKKVEDLSKGMGQKLQFVITVLHEPDLLILDEPFSGLDPVNANLIKEEIYQLASNGTSIIFSTHRMEQVEEICDHIILMNKGKKIIDGTVSQIKQQYKENLYSVTLESPPPLPENEIFDLITTLRPGHIQNYSPEQTLIIRIKENYRPNDVLHYLLRQSVSINGFQELLPSLNEIFIRLVEGTPQSRQFEKLNG